MAGRCAGEGRRAQAEGNKGALLLLRVCRPIKKQPPLGLSALTGRVALLAQA